MRQVPQFKKSNMGSYVLALYVGFHQTVQSVISLVADLSKIHVPEDLANSYEQLVGQLTDNNNLQKARVSTEEQDAADAERDRLVSYLFFVITTRCGRRKRISSMPENCWRRWSARTVRWRVRPIRLRPAASVD